MSQKNSFIIVIVAIIATAGYYFYSIQKGTETNNPQTVINDIAVGKPCNIKDLESYGGGGSITDTKGLQCYAYGPSSEQGARKQVWIEPNSIGIPAFALPDIPPLFFDFTLNWKTYNDPNGKYSFKYPALWKVEDSQYGAGIVVNEFDKLSSSAGVSPSQIGIYYQRNVKFENSNDYKDIKDLPDDLLNNLTYAKHFDLNGTPALLVERLKNFNVGAGGYEVTVYVIRPDSYITVQYHLFQDERYDIPEEMLVNTLRFK